MVGRDHKDNDSSQHELGLNVGVAFNRLMQFSLQTIRDFNESSQFFQRKLFFITDFLTMILNIRTYLVHTEGKIPPTKND